jgi:hypothetical protein
MWIAETYDDFAAVKKAGEEIHFRWDDFVYQEQIVTRFLTAHTKEQVLFTMHTAKVQGGVTQHLLAMADAAPTPEATDDVWMSLIGNTGSKIRNHKTTPSEDKAFAALSETQKMVLAIVQTAQVSELLEKRYEAGYPLLSSSYQQDDEMEIYEAINSRAGYSEIAEAFLHSLRPENRTITKLPSKKRRQRDAKLVSSHS